MINIKRRSEKNTNPPDLDIDTDFLREQLNDEQQRQRKRRLVIKGASVLVVIIAVSILVSTMWMPVLKIYSASMEPTLEKGDVVIALKKMNVRNGQLIAFYIGNKTLVKRVIAGPGDWVDIDDNGNVFVNEKLVDEPYVSGKKTGESDITFPYQVPESRFFVLGDNRAISMDSRSEYIGCVSEDQIIGEVVLKIWPPGGIGKL